MTEAKLITIAKYYIGNDVSIAELGKKYKFSKEVITRYLEGKREIRLPDDLQEQVNAKMAENWAKGKATHGNEGHTKLDEKQALQAARAYLTGKKTLIELAKELGVSRGTLYNNMLNPRIVGTKVSEALQQKIAARSQKNKSQPSTGSKGSK